jgi:phenylacetate-CoA ligase
MEIARGREAMRWQAAPGKVLLHRSSGTTDDNLKFYFDRERQAWDRALRMRTLAEFGVQLGDRQLQFSPVPIYWDWRNRLKEPARRLRDHVRCGIAFDLRPLSSDKLDQGLELLEEFEPVIVVAYPSWMTALAGRARQLRSSPSRRAPRVVLCVGEILYDFQKEAIERTFECVVAEEFGSHDSGVIAAEVPGGDLRLNWQYVCLEVRRDGRAARPGEVGEIVVTNFYSHVMPFIRYATGDVLTVPAGVNDGILASACPRIDGRTSDVLVTCDDRIIANRALVEQLVREMGSADFSIYQPSAKSMICMVTRSSGWQGREARAEEILRGYIGARTQIEWRSGESFRPLKSGKHRYVCSPAAHVRLACDQQAGLSLARAWPHRLIAA